MNVRLLILLFFIGALHINAMGQSNNATLKGTVKDETGTPLDMVNIALKDYPIGTSSNRKGEFLLRIPAEKEIVVVYSSIGYMPVLDTIIAEVEENIFREISMKVLNQQLAEVIVQEQRRNGGNVTRIDPKFIDILPDASTGAVEALIKTLPGVSTNNELSSQYTVRGGNFDENLVYV
ncbi:MAG: carboxypeptidase-like regulatory domain-containing protein, partial [Prolixibacteraceae bacterium]|nr:carboxypeptidase-like regulatory domain-containing protein [Prolixibacteraceae bacterium]